MSYNVIVSFHIISVIAWMTALFYLPRLFVYHASTEDEPGYLRFLIMEKKLHTIIMLPSMTLSWLFGIMAAVEGHWWTAHWFHAKMAAVLLMMGYQGFCSRFLRDFQNRRNTRSHVFYRFFNEIPTVLLIVIVLLVKLKPSF